MPETRVDGPDRADTQLILAHGAGQGMDSPFMTEIARQLSNSGIGVIRFNFPYMQESVITGKKSSAINSCPSAAVSSVDSNRSILSGLLIRYLMVIMAAPR